MNIAIDATPLSVTTGGVTRYTAELVRALAERYPENEYWLLSDRPFSMPDNVPRNLHRGDGPGNPVARKWWLWGLQQEMTRRRVDLFHGTDFSVPYLPLRPSVMTLHDLSPWLDRTWQPSAGRIRRRTPILLRTGLATMTITPTEAIRRAAIDRFRVAPDRIVAVPLAASKHFHRVISPPAPTPYFLFVGTLEPRKNIARMIEAWREVHKTHRVELWIAGRTRADFAAPPKESGLSLLGAVPEHDLPTLYSGASAVLYPSLYEGFGLPVLEALQCGALVITSCDPAITEVADGAAVHVDPTDTRAIGAALAAAVANPEHFHPLRERAFLRARDFSWRRTAELTREVYDAATQRFRR